MKIVPPLLIIAAFAILAVLFWWLRPATDASPAMTTVTVPAPPPATTPPSELLPPAAPALAEFEFIIADGKLVSGPTTLSAPEGETVTIRVRSDVDDDLHLHGYDLSLRVVGREMAELSFKANRSGRFPLELHHAQLELGALEIQPKP